MLICGALLAATSVKLIGESDGDSNWIDRDVRTGGVLNGGSAVEAEVLDARSDIELGFDLMRLGDQATMAPLSVSKLGAGEGLQGPGLVAGSGGRGDRVRDAQDWTALVSQYEWDVARALAVVACESSGFPFAVGIEPPHRFVGLFQIWTGHRWTEEDLMDPAINVAAAYELYERSGWAPWPSCPRR